MTDDPDSLAEYGINLDDNEYLVEKQAHAAGYVAGLFMSERYHFPDFETTEWYAAIREYLEQAASETEQSPDDLRKFVRRGYEIAEEI